MNRKMNRNFFISDKFFIIILHICSKQTVGYSLGALGSGGLDESNVDVGEDTTGGDGGILKELVEFLVVSDSELDVSGDDSSLLGVLGGVSSELENLSGEVLKDGSKVDGGTGTNSGGGSVLLEESSNSSDGELETSSGGLGHGS